MESIKDIFRIGFGPSSSHTMGPKQCATAFGEEHREATSFKVILYGSLAATGKGHLTDKAIADALTPKKVEFEWLPDVFLEKHPNALKIIALNHNSETIAETTAYSIGGGKILYDNEEQSVDKQIYPLSNMKSVLAWGHKNGKTFWEYVEEYEESDIWDYLAVVWKTMQETIERGILHEGVLPGGLKLPRKAPSYYFKARGYKGSMRRRGMLFAYALAASEENAGGGKVVTAPTCGSCGVLPSILYLLHFHYDVPDSRILHAIATAGLIGNIVKYNASISGAEVGCQGEIGTACAMTAGAAAQAFGGTGQRGQSEQREDEKARDRQRRGG
jgi:L-serine dehydratase